MTQEVLLPPTHRRYDSRCRLCFSDADERSCSLFPDAHHPASDHPATRAKQLVEMILECTSIQITLEEDYPAKVCEKCVETLDEFYQYRRRCLLNDQILREERQAATGHKNDAQVDAPARPPSPYRKPGGEATTESERSDTPSLATVRIKTEPLPRVDEEDDRQQQLPEADNDQHGSGIRTGPPHQQPVGVEHDAPSMEGGASSILRSILLQTRDSTTSRSSPNNTDPESARQTPQPQPQSQPLPLPPPSTMASASSPVAPVAEESSRPPQQSPEEDVKPSLLQQMLLQQASPARSPTKAGPSGGVGGTGSSEGAGNSPGGASLAGGSSSSSLLKRMLLDGSGTASNTSGELLSLSPLHAGTSQVRTKNEPLSATGTPSPPCPPDEDQLPATETPLASQLRSILLQHRAAAIARSESLSSLQQQQQQHPAKQNTPPASVFEKPEVSYIRSLFLRNDSDSEGEPPATEDQRELLLYTMFQELRARQQEQLQQHPIGFSSDSDDSDDLPQDYRLPSVRRRSTESIDSRSSKRRRTEYPCLLCGQTFAGRTKLVMHMRTHMMPPTAAANSLGLMPSARSSGPSAHLSNGGGGTGAVAAGGASDMEDSASPSPLVVAGRVSYSRSSAMMPAANANANANSASELMNVGNDDEEIDALERRSYACYICGADQNNLHQLKEHLLAAHQDRIRSRGRTRERQRASIGCEICHRQFRSQFAYGEHMRTHTGERPFPCDQCDKRFPRRFQLLGHLYNVHKQSWVADESKAKFAKK